MDQNAEQKQDTPQSETPSERISIIKAVQTPLGFFVLVVLVVEAILLGIVAGLSEGIDRTITIVGMLLLIGGLVGIVAFLAYNRPEALFGERAKNRTKPEPGFDQHLTGQWYVYYGFDATRKKQSAVGSAKIKKAKENDFSMTIKLDKSKLGRRISEEFEYEGKINNRQILTTFQATSTHGGFMVGTMVMIPNPEGDRIYCGAAYVNGNNKITLDKAILIRK